METIVLDASALIVYMRQESGASILYRELEDPHTKVILHVVNYYEVYYDTLRQQSALTHLLAKFIKKAGIQIYGRMDNRMMEEGALLKINHKMSLADSIALGLAKKLDATLFTADRDEFGAIAKEGTVKIKFIR